MDPEEFGRICTLVESLCNHETRAEAMEELGKMRDLSKASEVLAGVLWNSYGSIAALLQEVVCLYPLLAIPKSVKTHSTRTCNALALLQCVAAHPDTRTPFFKSGIVMFLFPILNTMTRLNQFELLRLTSLGVIGALVKTDDPEIIQYLLQTELIFLCLRIMDIGQDLSKTLAVFILTKIFNDDQGLAFVCNTPKRLLVISDSFSKVIKSVLSKPAPAEGYDTRKRLFRNIIRCYLRLVDDPHAVEFLQQNGLQALFDGQLANFFKDDPQVTHNLQQLQSLIQGPSLDVM